MPAHHRPLAAVLSAAALTLLAAPVDVGARPGGYGGGHGGGGVHGATSYHGAYPSGYYGGYGHGYFPGGVSIGVGLGFGGFYLGSPWYPGPWYYPGYTLAVPTYPVVAPPPEPPAKAPPEPIAYPREGQTPEQTEADRRACDRWAMTQPSAMADARIFHRATLACMEGRGYTVR